MATRAERRKRQQEARQESTGEHTAAEAGLEYLEQLDALDEVERQDILARSAPGRPEDLTEQESLEHDADALRQDAPSDESAEEQLRRDARATLPASAPDPEPRMAQERLESRIRFGVDDKTGKSWGPQPDGHNYCPKRPGTDAYDLWQTIVDGMTVSAFLAGWQGNGGRRRARIDMRWNIEHDFIYLQTAEDWAREQAERRAALWTESMLHEPAHDDESAEEAADD